MNLGGTELHNNNKIVYETETLEPFILIGFCFVGQFYFELSEFQSLTMRR